MIDSTGDRALYYRLTNDDTNKLLGTYVDDLLFAGQDKFHQLTLKLDEDIKMKYADEVPLVFAGLHIVLRDDGALTID